MSNDESMKHLITFLSGSASAGIGNAATLVEEEESAAEDAKSEKSEDAGADAASKSGTDYSFDFSSSAAVEKDEFIERMGVLMSVFFQNAKGQNVVDAIHENSKVTNELVKRLDAFLALKNT